MELIVACGLAFIFSLLFTRGQISLTEMTKWLVDRPTLNRWHKRETPSMGGIAIFLSCALIVLIFRQWDAVTMKIFGCSFLIFGLGLVDDLVELRPYIKLIGQIAAACLLVALDVRIAFADNPILYVPLTLVWVVAITNAFNLIDNMDGLSAGIAAIATFMLILLSGDSGLGPSLTLLGGFLGALLGFLVYNHSPARIFMGDCGAQWVGFVLSGLTIAGTWTSASNLFLMLATPLLVLGVPIFDTVLVTLNRKLHGISVSQGGRDHSSHRLVSLGLSERKTVWTLWSVAILFGLIALLAHKYEVQTWGLLASSAIVFSLIFGLFLAEAKVYQRSDVAPTSRKLLSFEIFHKRRIIEIIVDAILIATCYVLAFLLRYDWKLDKYYLDQLGATLPLILIAKLTVMPLSGLYSGLWTYINFESMGRLLRANFLGSVVSLLAVVAIFRFSGYSRTLFVIDFFLLFIAMAGTRALLRAFRESVLAFPETGTRLLVIGAGASGDYLLREIRKNRQWNLRPVGVLDDDEKKVGKSVVGIPIRGTRKILSQVIKDQNADHVVIAITSISKERLQLIEAQCESLGIPHTVMQSLEETLVRKIQPRGVKP